MRGQTTLDFAVGAVIFISVVSFVFLFVASAVSPFIGNPQDNTVTANRVADELAGDQLGSPADPYVLDTFYTRAFFNTAIDPVAGRRAISTLGELDRPRIAVAGVAVAGIPSDVHGPCRSNCLVEVLRNRHG